MQNQDVFDFLDPGNTPGDLLGPAKCDRLIDKAAQLNHPIIGFNFDTTLAGQRKGAMRRLLLIWGGEGYNLASIRSNSSGIPVSKLIGRPL